MPRLLLVVSLALAVGCQSRPEAAQPPASSASGSGSAIASEPRALANQRAFARLYGVIRWLHPSDEGAAIDWNQYAIHGAARVAAATSSAELAAALVELVGPIAPTVQILRPGESPRAIPTPTGELTWWQHVGPGLDGSAPPYLAKRRGKPAPVTQSTPDDASSIGTFIQRIDVTRLRGQPFRLRGQLRAVDGGRAQLWARIDRVGGKQGFFDNMMDRPVTAATWTPVEIAGTIDADANSLVLVA